MWSFSRETIAQHKMKDNFNLYYSGSCDEYSNTRNPATGPRQSTLCLDMHTLHKKGNAELAQ